MVTGLELIPIAIGAYSAAVSTVSTVNGLKKDKNKDADGQPVFETIMKQHIQKPRSGAVGSAQAFASKDVAWCVSGSGGGAFADCGGSWTETTKKEKRKK